MIDRYLAYLRSVRALSENTVAAYRRDLEAYRAYCRAGGLEEDSREAMRSFLGHLGRRGLASSTINRTISGLRGYFRFKQRFGLADGNPLATQKARGGSKALPSFLFQEEMDRFLPPDDRGVGTFRAIRDRAVFEFLYSTGCRVAESTALGIGDVDLKRAHARVRGKGGKERMVFLGEVAWRR